MTQHICSQSLLLAEILSLMILIGLYIAPATSNHDNQTDQETGKLEKSILEPASGQKTSEISEKKEGEKAIDLETLLDQIITQESAKLNTSQGDHGSSLEPPREDARDSIELGAAASELQATSETHLTQKLESLGSNNVIDDSSGLTLDSSEHEQPSTQIESTTANDIPGTSTPVEVSTVATTTSTIKTSTTKIFKESHEDDCLNNGVLVKTGTGQYICKCPPEYYGNRCQTLNICKTVIWGSETGEQICASIQRECVIDDKFFRCNCHQDEYFVFKPHKQKSLNSVEQQEQHRQKPHHGKPSIAKQHSSDLSTFAYDSDMLASPLPTTDSEPIIRGDNNDNNDNKPANDKGQLGEDKQEKAKATYVAQCNKIDKCVGVRCRQMSEVCVEGRCECNQNLGFIKDPWDGLCKVLDPCRLPQTDGRPICGEAHCVPTYDRELYRCICPIGYKVLEVTPKRHLTQCLPLTDLICNVPWLNKCQHKCKIHSTNGYKCSCLAGYKSGTRPGIDDHMCFFEEQLENNDDQADESDYDYTSARTSSEYSTTNTGRLIQPYDSAKSSPTRGRDNNRAKNIVYTFRAYVPSAGLGELEEHAREPARHWRFPEYGSKFDYTRDENSRTGDMHYKPLDEGDDENDLFLSNDERMRNLKQQPRLKKPRPRDMLIRREPIGASNMGRKADKIEMDSRSSTEDSYLNDQASNNLASSVKKSSKHVGSEASSQHKSSNYMDISQLSAQERCNMFCEENKICVLKPDSSDSYRCECDRQGYVSIGDRCLDWCEAAEFSHKVQTLLEKTCYSGVCHKSGRDLRHHFRANNRASRGTVSSNSYVDNKSSGFELNEDEEAEMMLLEEQSSWRPSFECDCDSSGSPVLVKDPKTNLCKLNFTEIIRPCLPGNEGYQDCVVNKHSYCAVLYKSTHNFLSDLLAEQLLDPPTGKAPKGASASAASSSIVRDLPSQQLSKQALSTANSDQQHQATHSSSSSNSNNNKRSTSNTNVKKLAGLLKAKTNTLYTCVCSPEKKFLIDKPREKMRCIDECDLLKAECGRFNRMCRTATIHGDDQDFGRAPLVTMDAYGNIRMNQFKRTGCKCLPGFNVGPSESVDFTLDDNYPSPTSTSFDSRAPVSNFIMNEASNSLIPGELAELEHLRTPYMNINSSCLLDYDVVEFNATFKAAADFEPAWISHNTQVTGRPAPAKEPSIYTPPPPPPPQPQPASASSNNGAPIGTEETGSTRPQTRASRPPELSEEICKNSQECILKMPDFMRSDISELNANAVLVAQCDSALAPLNIEMYRECTRYRYWVVQKLRLHFADWRQVMTKNLKETFDLMEGNIKLRVNRCRAEINSVETIPEAYAELFESSNSPISSLKPAGQVENEPKRRESLIQRDRTNSQTEASNGQAKNEKKIVAVSVYDPHDPFALVDADVHCELTIHSASDDNSRRHARKVLLEKQLPKFIFDKQAERLDSTNEMTNNIFGSSNRQLGQQQYYLMAPKALIQRSTFKQLDRHKSSFSPCNRDYPYCDKRTHCSMVDTVNFSCTCEVGYTPIGSRDIFDGDSRKEVCEDIDECLFDVCKENGLENKSICVNEIGDYRCQCIRHHVGDNKRYCEHICNVISCKFGDCRIPDEHHAFCECHEGYREADCSVQDPSVALRKANMIICGSIFTSVLLLAITLAISLNSQLKKTKKKLKRLEAAFEASQLFELPSQQTPFSRPRMSKVSSGS